MEISLIPDSLLLKVFEYLSVKDICLLSRVCKRWRQIASDKTLWRHIDLTNMRMNLKKAWKFYRTRLSDCVLSLKLKGQSSGSSNTVQRKHFMSDALMEEISVKCPNINALEISKTDLSCFSSTKLPPTLTCLTLQSHEWPLGWLHRATLPCLQSLDLAGTVRIDDNEIKDIVKFSTLEKLVLTNCYRITNVGIKMISENLLGLMYLDLSMTRIDDLCVHHICCHLSLLRSLNVESTLITNEAVECLSISMKNLNVLNIACTKTDKDCLIFISKIKELKVLKHSIKLDIFTDSDYVSQLQVLNAVYKQG